MALGIRFGPAGQLLGHGIHEQNVQIDPRGDDAVVDAMQDCGEKALLLLEPLVYAVFVQRDIDRRIELALLEGLEDIPERLSLLRALEGP